MQLQPEQLNEYFKPVFIFASKLQQETDFFLQIVDSEKKAKRLKSFFLGKGNEMTWYMYETTLPLYCPPEIDLIQFDETNKPNIVLEKMHQLATTAPLTPEMWKGIKNAELF